MTAYNLNPKNIPIKWMPFLKHQEDIDFMLELYFHHNAAPIMYRSFEKIFQEITQL